MGLKETLKMQMQESLTEPMNNPASDSEMLQALRLQNSELQLENQNLLLQMMSANEQIESLTSRAASVNQIEQENLSLKEEAENARSEAIKAAIASNATADRHEAETQRRIAAEHLRGESEQKCLAAHDEARKTETQMKNLKERYRHIFVGIVIFTVSLAIMNAYNHRSVLTEYVQWFIDRWGSIVSIIGFLQGTYFSFFDFIGREFPNLTESWRYAVASAVALTTLIVIIVLLRFILACTKKSRKKFSRKLREAFRNELKIIVNVAMSISLFHGCLHFYEPITSLVSMNIFSVWIILSITTTFLIFLPDIISM